MISCWFYKFKARRWTNVLIILAVFGCSTQKKGSINAESKKEADSTKEIDPGKDADPAKDTITKTTSVDSKTSVLTDTNTAEIPAKFSATPVYGAIADGDPLTKREFYTDKYCAGVAGKLPSFGTMYVIHSPGYNSTPVTPPSDYIAFCLGDFSYGSNKFMTTKASPDLPVTTLKGETVYVGAIHFQEKSILIYVIPKAGLFGCSDSNSISNLPSAVGASCRDGSIVLTEMGSAPKIKFMNSVFELIRVTIPAN